MSSHREEFSIEMMARVLDVSRAGFYSYLRRDASTRERNRQRIDLDVHTEFIKSRNNYGAVRIKKALDSRGISHDIKTIGKSLKRQNLHPKKPKKFVATTDSAHSLPVAANVIGRNFEVTAPNQKWVTDITYLPSLTG